MSALFRWIKTHARQFVGVGFFAAVFFASVFVPVAKADRLSDCRAAIAGCVEQGEITGDTRLPADCYQSATAPGGLCVDVPREAALDAPPVAAGAVSGSNIQPVNPSVTNQNLAAMRPGECVTAALARDASLQTTITSIEASSQAERDTWTCRRLCSTNLAASCVTGGCPGTDTAIACCPPALGSRPGDQCGATGATAGAGTANPVPAGSTGGATPPAAGTASTGGGAAGGAAANTRVGATSVSGVSGGLSRLVLPSCTSDGSCQISDFIQMALNLVRFLFGLAGVLLLVVFIYAGMEYLLADTVTTVKSAEERIKKALLGLFFMFFGYTLVNFLVGVFLGL